MTDYSLYNTFRREELALFHGHTNQSQAVSLGSSKVSGVKASTMPWPRRRYSGGGSAGDLDLQRFNT